MLAPCQTTLAKLRPCRATRFRPTVHVSTMSYKEAVRLAATRFKNIKYVPAAEVQLQPGRLDLTKVRRWVKALGLERTSFDVIHVTGTKGKGNTCAWTQALLQSYFRSNSIAARVGRYTSPHLTTPRERMVIGSSPVSEAVYADRFFHVWNTILADVGGKEDEMPGFLQLMALLSADVFAHEKVDVAVYEVHAGGRVDATNMWDDRTMVCGFNTIGLDHVPLLGNNVAEIARNKAGIMKPGCRAFSVPQLPEAREQLEAEASHLGCPITFLDPTYAQVPTDRTDRAALQLPALRGNLALSIELANAYLESRFEGRLSDDDIAETMRTYQLPGRMQVVEEPESQTRWYLDIAHNDISIPVALDWFISEVRKFDGEASPRPRRTRTLVFGQASKHRDAVNLINVFARHCRARDITFDRIILSAHANIITGKPMFAPESAKETAPLWRELAPVEISPSIHEALRSAQTTDNSDGSHVLVVGSSHLVSSALKIMQDKEGSPA
ncbi:hypothetical protein RB600_008475 [Gaeumannomyces tritici]